MAEDVPVAVEQSVEQSLAASSPVWVVGTVTRDLFGATGFPGGAASYIARTCEALGVPASVLIAAGADASLEALEHVAPGALEVVAAQTQTFRHEQDAQGERVLLFAQGTGHTLAPSDVPASWEDPATLLLAPLMPEDIDVLEFIDAYPAAEVGLLAQGLQRAVLPDGQQTIANRAQPSVVLLDAARPNVTVFLSRQETRLWAVGTIEHLAARCARVVVTDGERGATVYTRTGRSTVPAVPAQPVDTTGAGDVFAAAYILGLRAGEQVAGRLAAACAAVAVEVVGPALLPPRAVIESRMSPPDASPAGAS